MNYEALGIYIAHKNKAQKASSRAKELFAKLEHIAKFSNRSDTLVAKFDTKYLQDIVDELAKLDKEIESCLDIANKAAKEIGELEIIRPFKID